MPPHKCPPHVPECVFDNIDGDGFSPEALRNEILEMLAATADITEAIGKYEAWRLAAIDSGKLIVTEVVLEANEQVGHLRYQPMYEKTLAQILRTAEDSEDFDETDLVEFVRWLFGEPASIDPNTAEFLFDELLAEKTIETDEGWYFREAAHGENVLLNVELPCLPWNLALPYVRSGSSYAAFEVSSKGLPGGRHATFLDVMWPYHELWRPNGLTAPHKDTPDICAKLPLEEILSLPPKFKHIKRPITTLSAR